MGRPRSQRPAFVSTLCICIVFVPVVFLTGPAAYLFTPLALAVVFAMLASYFLSRTLVPTMVLYLLPAEAKAEAERRQWQTGRESEAERPWFVRYPSSFHHAFNRGFERLRLTYSGYLDWALDHRLRDAWRLARLRDRLAWRCFRVSARTSSPPSTPASSACTSVPRPEPASRKPSGFSARSKMPSARSCPTANGP